MDVGGEMLMDEAQGERIQDVVRYWRDHLMVKGC